MAKKTKTVETAVVVAGPVATYELSKTPRNGLNANTKHGAGGTAGTYGLVAALLAKGPATLAEIQAVCKENGDSGFARYAIRNNWVAAVKAAE